MRSRYSAYVLNLKTYLLLTWHQDTRPSSLNLENYNKTKWLGLKIKYTENSVANNAKVEFVAHYKIRGKAEQLHEISRFQKVGPQWYYLDGQLLN